MTMWAFALGPWQSEPGYAVTTARARKLAFRLDAPTECSFSIDGRSLDAGQLSVLESDLWVYRDSVLYFRGRVIAAPEQLDADRHTVSVSAIDYRGLLNRRFLQSNLSYAAQPQAAIAAYLIAHTQTQPGGDLGITWPSLPSGNNRDRNYLRGDSVGERIAELGRVENGFDWWIGPDRVLHVESPQRGVLTNVVLDFGGVLAAVNRQADAGGFANQVQVTGGSGTTTVAAVAADVATDPRGRWERTFSFPSIVDQATLQPRANRLLSEGGQPPVAYSGSIAPGRWTGQFGLGDFVWLRLESGVRQELALARIEELSVSLDDSGNESVDFAATASAITTEPGEAIEVEQLRSTEGWT